MYPRNNEYLILIACAAIAIRYCATDACGTQWDVGVMLILYIRKVVMNSSKSCFVWWVGRSVRHSQQLDWFGGCLALRDGRKPARMCNNKRLCGIALRWVAMRRQFSFYLSTSIEQLYLLQSKCICSRAWNLSHFMLKAIECTVIISNILLPSPPLPPPLRCVHILPRPVDKLVWFIFNTSFSIVLSLFNLQHNICNDPP